MDHTNPRDQEERRSRINPQQEELKLTDLCEQLLELFSSLRMIEEEDEVKFWDSFKEFYWHANKSKQRYKIEESVDKLTDLKANVEVAMAKKKMYNESGFEEREMEYNQKVLLLFASIIQEVERIKDKSLEIESKKIEKISSEWAGQFLLMYSNIILDLGALDHITTVSLLYDIQMPDRFMLNLKHQQAKLHKIRKEITNLSHTANVPEDIIDSVRTLSVRLDSLINSYKEIEPGMPDDMEKLTMILDSQYVELRKSILYIYRDTLDRCFSS